MTPAGGFRVHESVVSSLQRGPPLWAWGRSEAGDLGRQGPGGTFRLRGQVPLIILGVGLPRKRDASAVLGTWDRALQAVPFPSSCWPETRAGLARRWPWGPAVG